jgi:hypothetical protein
MACMSLIGRNAPQIFCNGNFAEQIYRYDTVHACVSRLVQTMLLLGNLVTILLGNTLY